MSSEPCKYTQLIIIATAGFDIVPSPLNVTVEQQLAFFHCQHNDSDDITWRVNETTQSRTPLNYTTVPRTGGGLSSSLSIQTHLNFNRTTIECVAVFFHIQGSSPFQFTAPVTLLIQGM